MSNLVLYRKYRPKNFSEVVGQEHVVQTLQNAVSVGPFSHAYLFSGPRGSGKTTIARLLAKTLNCQNRKKGQSEPCNKCSSCREILENRAIDLIEIDAASNRGIDEIRELRDAVRFRPTKSRYRVFIIDESHQLSRDAANALLKTLEEPPPHAVFILATTEIHKMIPTIVSRCQRFDFRKLNLPEIISRLELIAKKEKAEIEKPALELIALNSGGSLRDAEGLLDQVLVFAGRGCNPIRAEDIKELLGMVDINLVSQFTSFLCQRKSGEALSFLTKIFEKGKDPQEFAKALIRYLRQGLIIKINPNLQNPILTGLTSEERLRLQSQISGMEEARLRRILKLFLEAQHRMKYSPIPQLPLELAVIESLQAEQK